MDPDGNIHQGQACGGSLNATLACDEKVDALLNRAREISDVAQRTALYREAIDLIGARRNVIYLYHPNYIVALPEEPQGLQGRARRPHPRQGHLLELIDMGGPRAPKPPALGRPGPGALLDPARARCPA